MYPEKLARRPDAYKYKRGILNRMFTHTEQLEVADTEQNKQSYLHDFRRLGLQWTTTMKPRGKTFTTAAVMTADITFADEGSSDAGGKFRVVEPRQVFPGGRLQFLVPIIPNSSNRSTISAFEGLRDVRGTGIVAAFDLE